jgi:hypothetical protein
MQRNIREQHSVHSLEEDSVHKVWVFQNTEEEVLYKADRINHKLSDEP